jgi:hypothetical protein
LENGAVPSCTPSPSVLSPGKRRARRLLALAVTGMALLTPTSVRTQSTVRAFYVSPAGTPGNDGTLLRPLDLATALSSKSPAKPGDTIWLRGGLYEGAFVSNLTGTASAPIIVRAYRRERVTVNASSRTAPALTVNGSDTWFWGFEVTDTNPVRVVASGQPDPRSTSVHVAGPRTKFINLVVHDGQLGFGFWTPAVDAELYGNLIYNVGFEKPDRGHGHSIYVQNETGVKRIVDNILFNGFSFNHGILSKVSGAKANLYMRGNAPVSPVVQDNYLYHSPFGSEGRNIELLPTCVGGSVTGNYSAGGTAMSLFCRSSTIVTGNFLAGRIQTLGSYADYTYLTARPTGLRVFVRPNKYEPGVRGHITVFNWDKLATVPVDLSAAGLPVGASFEIRDAQNYFGAPVATGKYAGGPVNVPMTGLTVAPPVGNAPIVPAHTAPEFGAFVLVRSDEAVEKALYWSSGSQPRAGGTNVTAVRLR